MHMKGKRLTVLEGGVLYLNTLLVKAKGGLIGCRLPTTQCPKPDLETAPFFLGREGHSASLASQSTLRSLY